MDYYNKINEIENKEKLNTQEEITALGLKQRYGRIRNKIKRHSSSKKESGEDLYDDDYLDESALYIIKPKALKLSNRSIIGIDKIKNIELKASSTLDHVSENINESTLYEFSFFGKKKVISKPSKPYTEEDLEELIEYVYESELLAYTYTSKSAEVGFTGIKKILDTDEMSGEANRAKILKETFRKWEDYRDDFISKRKDKVKGYRDGRMFELYDKIMQYINKDTMWLKEQKNLAEIQNIAANHTKKINSLYEKFTALRNNLVNRANDVVIDIDKCGSRTDRFAYSSEIYMKIIYNFAIKQAEFCAEDLLLLSDILRIIRKI